MSGPNNAAILDGVGKTIKWLKAEKNEAEKAQVTAVRVEGFRLKNLLQKEIQQGAPGGRTFAPLSFIARRLVRQIEVYGGRTERQSPNRKPLARLVHGIRYNIATANPFKMMVGFVQPGRGPHSVSKSWRRLAQYHQTGFPSTVSDSLRRLIVWRGGMLGSMEGQQTPFFLKRATHQFRTPARPIVDPFWQTHKNTALENISKNFRLKMAGKRI